MRFKGKNIELKRIKNKLWLKNYSSDKKYFIDTKKIKLNKGVYHFSFGIDKEAEIKIHILNNKFRTICTFFSNTDVYKKIDTEIDIRIMVELPKSFDCTITKCIIKNENQFNLKNILNAKNLLISPGYPSINDRYLCGFVHTRVKEYKKCNLSFDVLSVNDYNEITIYYYENVKVVKLNYFELRELLLEKKYENIFIHFFNEKFAITIDNIDLHESKLYFYAHGAETLYRDWSKMSCEYFQPTVKLSTFHYDLFHQKDEVIKKYNNVPNAKWIFVTNWTKTHSEELLNIKYNNYDIIPCYIDTNLFAFQKKDPDLRKKIFILRKFDNINSYAIDIDVRIILELSKRKIFNDLEFDIYGDGSMHDILLEPLRQFPNVKIHQKFLTHQEISEVHKKHGIALFATRYDSQAVSSCEAASSGCVVVSSINPGILQEFDEQNGTLCIQENYKDYADVIERLYYNPEEFVRISQEMSKKIYNIYGFEQTIGKELKMLKQDEKIKLQEFMITKADKKPLLTIIIPAYNVEKYIEHTIWSLINQKFYSKLEILVINDGSKDNTLKKAQEYANKVDKTHQIIKVINKENGGHGSVLNVGISLAKGKYVKIIDGDDTVNSQEFEKLLEKLQNENTDIILTNYNEDVPSENRITPTKFYNMLVEGIEYDFEDLCYDNYGFNTWGPLLSTSTYKLDMIKQGNFKISEKMPYDDMEWNLYIYFSCKTIKYYDFNVYNYFIGREGQTISADSLKKKYPMHRKMVSSLLNIYNENFENLSINRRILIEQKIILKMIQTHYHLVLTLIKKAEAFKKFDDILKQYPYFYNNPQIIGKRIKFYRLTKGHFMWLQKWL